MIERWNATCASNDASPRQVAASLFGEGCIVEVGEADEGGVDWESEDVGVEDEKEDVRQTAIDFERVKREIFKRFEPPRFP